MKNKHPLKSLLALILVIQMLLSPIVGSVVYADDTRSAAGEKNESVSDASQGIDAEIIPPQNQSKDKLIGDTIITKEGFKIQMNADGASYTVLEYLGSSEEVDIIATYAELNKPAYPITRIADTAFYGNRSVTRITLPSTVVFVGEYSFSACPNLQYNVIDGGNYIGSRESADGQTPANDYFYFDSPEDNTCTELTVHSDTVIVGAYAFAGCKDLKKVVMGEKIVSIGYAAMGKDSLIEDLTVPFLGENGKSDSNGFLGFIFGARTYGGNISYVPLTLKNLSVTGGEFISRNALYGVDMIESLTMPYLGSSLGNTETNYLSYAFGGTSYEDNAYLPAALKSVTVLGGEIGENAFRNTKLTSVTLENGVTSIGESAFYDCSSLTSITIPGSVTSIGRDAFIACYSLASVYISDIGAWCGIKFDNNSLPPWGWACLYLDGILVTDIDIPEGVTSISDYAFSRCYSLTSITIPDSLTSVGYCAFEYCNSLRNACYTGSETEWRTKVTVDSGNNNLINVLVFMKEDPDGTKKEVVSLSKSFKENVVSTINIQADTLSNLSSITAMGVLTVDSESTGLRFSSNRDGTCSVAGFFDYSGSDLIIPSVSPSGDRVTSIDSYAFYNCSSLRSVTIPFGVKSIGESAFQYCRSLFSVAIPESVTSIGGSAFHNCSSLTKIKIPNSVRSIGMYAFADTAYYNMNSNWNYGVLYIDGHLIEAKKSGLLPIYAVKEGTLTIADGAFYGCSNLMSVTIPNSVTSIGDSAFYGCSALMGIKIPESVTSIESGAFYGCSALMDIKIPESVTSISAWAFQDCSSLKSVAIPESVTSIGGYAFRGCISLISITIPGSVKNIHVHTFSDCNNLTSVTILEGVTSIGDSAFYGCSSLKSVAIPGSVTSIDDRAFYDCSSLSGVYIGDIGAWCSINFGTYYANPLYYANKLYLNGILVTNLMIPEGVTSISSYAFEQCNSLISVAIPGNVTSIGRHAFEDCSGLQSVKIAEGVTSISGYAFRGCISLISITIPNSIRKIDSESFVNCTNLSTITYDGERNEWRHVQKATNWDEGSSNYTLVFREDSGLLFDADEELEHFWISGFTAKGAVSTDVKAPAVYSGRPVTVIYARAFDGNTELTSLYLPDRIVEIGEFAFRNCSSLKTINLPTSLQTVDSGIFTGCGSLENLELPFLGRTEAFEKDEYLGYYFGASSYAGNASYIPTSIKTVTVLKADEIAESCFKNCRYIENITLPEGITSIAEYAFSGCSALTSFVIPNSVETVGAMLFDGCNAIKTITIGENLETIGDYAAGTPLFGINKNRSVLQSYVVSDKNKTYSADEYGVLYRLFDVDGSLVRVSVMDAPAMANLSRYILPELIVEISPYAFAYNSTLRSIDLKYVRRIANNAFYMADGLIYVKLHYSEEENTEYKISNDKLSDVLEQIEINQYIGKEAFMGCTSLISVDIDSDNIIGIDDFAFADCSSLTDVALGRKIKLLGLSAFGATESGESNIEWFEVHKENKYFKSIDGVLYSISDGKLTLELFPAMAIQAKNNRVVRTEYRLPAGQNIVAIQSYAFRGVKGLKHLVIDPDRDMIVGDYAFSNSSIESIEIGKRVTSLGLLRGESEYTVFSGTEYLTEITVSSGNSYYSSKNGVLFDKKQQKLIKYPSAKIGDEYYLPNTVHSIASMAFKGNRKLKLLVITSNVSTVGLEAFYGCSELFLIYFKDVYAPTSIMENAFTTFVKIDGGSVTNPRTQIGYSDSYLEDGPDGEYGWNNYIGIYNLVANPDIDIQIIDNDADFYGIVVVDSAGDRLGNMMITLTDPNGVSETVLSGHSTEGNGIAIFFDLYGVEGLGFSIDYENSYSITVSDPEGKYFTFTNPSFYLDEDMKITYITVTQVPSAYGLTCGETDINSERAELNKAEYEYTVSFDKDGNVLQAGKGGAVTEEVIHQVVEISVIAYCDKEYRFTNENGNPLPGVAALYQNGVKIADVSRAELRDDGGVVLYFTIEVYTLAVETDIEVRVTAMHDSAEPLSCRTVLNIHVFDFLVTDEDVDLDMDDMDIDFSAAGDLLKTLIGSDSIKIGSNLKFLYNIDKDTITLGVEGSKTVLDKKSEPTLNYKEGYEANYGAHEKNTYLFSYQTLFKDEKKGLRTIKYNIRFARGSEDDGYYYYCCRIYDMTGTNRAEEKNKLTTFYGLVNKPNVGSWKDRNAAKLKADIIFMTHSAYFFQKDINKETGKKELVYKSVDDIKKISGKYTELVWWKQELKTQKQTSNKLNIEFSGDIKFKYEAGGFKPVASTIKGKLIYTYTHNQQLMVWAIPITVEVQVKASGEIKLKFGLDENEKFSFEELLLTLGLDINAKVGVGCSVASVGLYGNIGTVLVIELAPDTHIESWKISGELGGYAKLLFFEKQVRFTPDSWKGDGYYIKGSSSATEMTAKSVEFSEEIALASMYLADSYTSIDSGDLNNYFEIIIIEGKLYKLCYADVSGSGNYDEYNYVKFALSKWNEESGEWEEPVIIDDNGLNDTAYSFYRNGDSLFMIYTQQTKKMTADTINDTYASAQGLAIKVVKLTSNDIQSEQIGKRENYAYLAQYSLVNGVPTVIWAENADNNIFGVSPYNYIDNEDGSNPLAESHVFATKANSIWISRFVNGEWSAPECLENELSAITQLALNEKGVIAYVIDVNGDLTNTDDRVMYYGSVNGFRSSLNNINEGSVVYVKANKSGFIYYYDEMYTEGEEENDGWYTIITNISGEIYSIPQNAPMEFVSVFDENGKLSGIVYSSNKKWIDDTGTERTGSAVYAIFVSDGVWGEPVEIDSFAAEADRYVCHLSAAMRSGNLILTANTVNASGKTMKQIQCEYICESKLSIVDYTVDYPSGTVTFKVTNVGAMKTPVYISLDGGAYTLMTTEPLHSGESVFHTLRLPDSSRLHRIDVAISPSGKGVQSIEGISLTYSDLQPFTKQILLGSNNVLLLAVKNTGNLSNTGTTVIRVGSNNAESIVSDAMRKEIDKLTLSEGEIQLVEFVGEKGETESFWIVKDSIDAGGIVYHEINLSGENEIPDGSLIGVYTIPELDIENGYASENNFSYLNYNQCAGILKEGDEIPFTPKLTDTVINYDPENEKDITLGFTCSDEDRISEIRIDGQVIPESGYSITKMLVGGTVLISHNSEITKNLSAGQHIVTVIFNSGEECSAKLRVTAYYKVEWKDGDTVLALQEKTKEGTIPLYDGIPEKAYPDESLVYVFAGWDSNGDGSADIISAMNRDMTYYAVWKVEAKKHTVTWKLKDPFGNECEITESYTHNALPAYKGTIPTPQNMIFNGWDKEILEVTEDAVYTAEYFNISDFSLILSGEDQTVVTGTSFRLPIDVSFASDFCEGISCFSAHLDFSAYTDFLTFESCDNAAFTVTEEEGVLHILSEFGAETSGRLFYLNFRIHEGENLPESFSLALTVNYEEGDQISFTQDGQTQYPYQIIESIPSVITVFDKSSYDYNKDGILSIGDVTALLDILADQDLKAETEDAALTIGDVTKLLNLLSRI